VYKIQTANAPNGSKIGFIIGMHSNVAVAIGCVTDSPVRFAVNWFGGVPKKSPCSRGREPNGTYFRCSQISPKSERRVFECNAFA
jgi:hypothetical protein